MSPIAGAAHPSVWGPRPPEEDQAMSEHPNVTLLRRAADEMQSEGVQAMAKYLADDVVWHEIGRAAPRRGIAELSATAGAADYDITWETHDIVVNDDHVVVLGTATATRGDRTLTYRTAEILHVKDGKITERWAFSDDTAAIVDFFA
jgi:ketosteroid isomerase-like protein